MMFPQIITDLSGVNLSGTADTMAKNLLARLEEHYPAYRGFWRVTVNEQGGVVEVTNLALSGRWGFLMHIAKIDAEGRKVVRHAGELLERYRMSRCRKFTIAGVAEAVATAERNFRGELVHD